MSTRLLAWTGASLAILGGLALWMKMGLAVALSDGAWFCTPPLG